MSDMAPRAAGDDSETHETEEQAASSRTKPKKAPNAFRTISEVADELHIPQHVLRFWEGRFPQIKPLKRGGGRRYYRPDDIQLLRRISDLLYIQGYTIKGVQRLLRESGGHLSDDIPPPAAGERSADEPDDQAELPMLELEAPAQGTPRSAAKPRQDPEVARLRALLAETLAELERLRALVRSVGL